MSYHLNKVWEPSSKELMEYSGNYSDYKLQKAISPAFEIINKGVLPEKLSPTLVQVKNLSKSYDEKVVFSDISFNIMREDKLAVIGDNGAGKTSLVKIINGSDEEYKGEVALNPSVKIGSFHQELENLKVDNSVLNEVMTRETTINESRLLLASLMFRGDEVYKKVENLSMGEKCRVAFAKLILSGANLLVLDEITNYMDIISREKVEEVLREFKGCIIFVSHDRYLIRKLANKIMLIENKGIKVYEGDYDYYLQKSKEEHSDSTSGRKYRVLKDQISMLECEIAFLSGKLDSIVDPEEKDILNDKFIKLSRELRVYKEEIKDIELNVGNAKSKVKF